MILENGYGLEVEVSVIFEFPTTNNQAEYEVLVARIMLAGEMGVECTELRTNSQLVIFKTNGNAQANDHFLPKYLKLVGGKLA